MRPEGEHVKMSEKEQFALSRIENSPLRVNKSQETFDLSNNVEEDAPLKPISNSCSSERD